MGKKLKLKDESSRLALVEYIVEKRLHFLLHLSDLHRVDGGVLWMGTVRITREDVARHFCPPATAQPVREIRVAVERSANSGDASPAEIVVPLPNSLSRLNCTSGSWLATNLPRFVCLGVSLAELLQAPLNGMEFLDNFYTMLLEFDLCYASSTTNKALASRNLRNRRRHMTQRTEALSSDSSNSHGGDTIANGLRDTEGSVKYVFLTSAAYLPALEAVHYEEIIVPLLAQLTKAYKRLKDTDIAHHEEPTKCLLSIDRFLQRIFFGVVCKELGKLSRLKLFQQTWLLSTGGLFGGLKDNIKSST